MKKQTYDFLCSTGFALGTILYCMGNTETAQYSILVSILLKLCAMDSEK